MSAKSECPENEGRRRKSVGVVPFILFLADQDGLGYTSATVLGMAAT